MATHRFLIDGKEYEVDIGTRVGGNVQVIVNGTTYEVEISGQASPPPTAATARPAVASVAPVTPRAAPASAGAGEVRAPIPGVVLSIAVAPGDKVTEKTNLLVLEAMKMENEIFAQGSGVIAQVHVKPQQEVRQGDLLVTITPD